MAIFIGYITFLLGKVFYVNNAFSRFFKFLVLILTPTSRSDEIPQVKIRLLGLGLYEGIALAIRTIWRVGNSRTIIFLIVEPLTKIGWDSAS